MSAKVITYGVRKQALCPAERLAAALKSGEATGVSCCKCGAPCAAHTPTLEQARRTSAALGIPLEISCFECSIDSGKVTRAEVTFMSKAGGGAIVELEPGYASAFKPPKAKA